MLWRENSFKALKRYQNKLAGEIRFQRILMEEIKRHHAS